MRKTISLVLVVAMVLSVLAFVPTTSAATLDAHNVQVDAQYFSGTTEYAEVFGTIKEGYDWYDPYTIKEGNDSDGILTIDGKIDDGEWTGKVYHIDSDYAPNNNGMPYGNNALFEVPSAENTYYLWLKDGNNKSLAPAAGLEYDVRLMWDEEFFYMAVSYSDTDGNFNQNYASDGSNWDGDSIQFRLDPAGPNAVVGGKGYNAAVDSFPYDPEIHGETDTTANCTFPWDTSDTTYNSYAQETHSTIGNFIFSYYRDGYTDMCDASKRYWPTEVEIPQDDGTVKTEIQYSCADISPFAFEDYAGQPDSPLSPAYACAYSYDSNPHPAFVVEEISFEIALPWCLVREGYAPSANDELGFSMVRFNTALGNGAYNSFLEWGTGICGHPVKEMPQVVGGSNCLVLTEQNAMDTEGCEHEFADASCLLPINCIKCGYQKGFVAGHKYDFSHEILPTGSKNGNVSGTCTVCGHVFSQTINSQYAETWYDLRTDEASFHDQGWESGSGFTIQWETLDEEGKRYTEETDPTGTLRQLLWNPDGSAKHSYNKDKFGYAVADLTIDGQTGTYYASDSVRPSFTEKADVYITDLSAPEHVEGESDPYNNFFGNWFGGTAVAYAAGLVQVEGEYYFAIYPSALQVIKSYDALAEKALCITPAKPGQVTANEWHEYVFMFDSESETAMLMWDGELVASACDYHFRAITTNSKGEVVDDNDVQAILRQFQLPMYVKDVALGSAGLAAQYVELPDPGPLPEGGSGDVEDTTYTVTVNGVATEYKAGESVTISADALYESNSLYYRFNGWTGDVDAIGDAAAATVTFTMPEADVTVEASYLLIGDVSGDGKVNATDANLMKRIAAGQIDSVIAGDVNGDGSVNAQDANLLVRLVAGSYTPVK